MLQVLEAWCGKVKASADAGLAGKMSTIGTTKHQSQRGVMPVELRLSEVMDLTMAALVHPSKLLSSVAPVLLEHVVSLRQVSIGYAY